MKLHHLLFVGIAAWGGMMAYRAQKVITGFFPQTNTEASSNYDGSGIGNIGYSGGGDIFGAVSSAAMGSYRPAPSDTGDNFSGSNYGNNSSNSSPFNYRDPAKENAEQVLAMLKAAAEGNVQELQRYTDDKARVNARDGQRRTALMFASLNGQNDAARMLLSSGANVKLKDPRGFNALDYAAGRGHSETVRLLLQASGTKDEQNAMQYAQLMEASFAGDKNRLPQGKGNLSSVNDISPEDQTPLIVAAGNGSADLVQNLIERGADVNLRNSQRQTALHWAAWNNKPATLSALLAKGAKIDATDLGGNTALMFAAQNGNQEAVSLLLAHGADTAMTDQRGSTAMTMAKTKGHKNITSMMEH